jgi:hypothetical protein
VSENGYQELRQRAAGAALDRLLDSLVPPDSDNALRTKLRNLIQSGALSERRLAITAKGSAKEEVLTVREILNRFTHEEFDKLADSGNLA